MSGNRRRVEQEPSRSASGGASGAASGNRRARSSKRRIDVLVVLGLLLPVAVAGALAVIGDESDPTIGTLPPVETDLTAATVVCAPAVTDGEGSAPGEVLALRAPGVDGGEVTVSSGRTELSGDRTVEVGPAPVEVPSSPGAISLDAEGAAAPGLVAGRRQPLVAGACRAPGYDEWFLGLGASARNGSVITLVNPDATQAVADVTLLGRGGPVTAEALRDVPVPPAGVVRLDLAELVPRRGSLAARVQVTRGRVATSVTHRSDELGAGRVSVESLPPQSDPDTENLLLGIDAAARSGTLTIANPGDDEVRTTVRVVNDESVFAPSETEDVVVPPLSQVVVPVSRLVGAESAEGMRGLELRSSGSVVATVRSVDRGDLVEVGAAERIDEGAAVVVPPGDARLVVGGAQRTGTVRVTAYGEDGDVLLDQERVEIGADRAVELELPGGVAALTVAGRNTPIRAAVVVESDEGQGGSTVVPVRVAEMTSRIPVVVPR